MDHIFDFWRFAILYIYKLPLYGDQYIKINYYIDKIIISVDFNFQVQNNKNYYYLVQTEFGPYDK